MNKKIDVEQSVRALFGLCKDITRLNARDGQYYYFCPKRDTDLSVIKYILSKNNVPAALHKTHYYGPYGKTRPVLRVHLYDMVDCKNTDFKSIFDKFYADKEEFQNMSLDQDTKAKLFWLWNTKRKHRFIDVIADKTK